jgi:hypothetical protein
MGFHDTQFRTVTCEGPECKNTVTFEVNQQDPSSAKAAHDANPWLNTIRIVQASGLNHVYCSDDCEISAVGAGYHNPKERKSILLPDASNAVQVAAAQAAQVEAANRALKTGGPVTLHGN